MELSKVTDHFRLPKTPNDHCCRRLKLGVRLSDALQSERRATSGMQAAFLLLPRSIRYRGAVRTRMLQVQFRFEGTWYK